MEEIDNLPTSIADTLQTATTGVSILLGLVGNVPLGVAVWRSGILPKWAGALWAVAPVLMYIFGLVYAMTIGANATPPTVPAVTSSKAPMGPRRYGRSMLWPTERRSSAPQSRGA
jgi:hypothetical protein